MSERSPPESSESLLDVLARRPRLDLDAGVEQVVGLGEPEPARAAREQRLEELREVRRHVGEGGGEHVDDLVVDRLDDLGQLAAGSPSRPRAGPRGTRGAPAAPRTPRARAG